MIVLGRHGAGLRLELEEGFWKARIEFEETDGCFN
jgi:hypothetical protein